MKKVMKNKKILLIIFSLLLIAITSFCIAINKKGNVFYNLVHKQEKLADDEIELDNWEISTVFYDSTVNNGKTPLTEINWDASNLAYNEYDTRVITVQINYKNTNAITTYEPGDLSITIPNLLYQADQMDIETNYSVNDSTHTGYEWNLASNTTADVLVFKNANIIETRTNLEGSIQLSYTMTTKRELDYTYEREHSAILEGGEDECEHQFNRNIKASLNNTIESNTINFSFYRLYSHPWTHKQYTLQKTPNKVTSYDGLGNNANNYFWVSYSFSWNSSWNDFNGGTNDYEFRYPTIFVKRTTFQLTEDDLPAGAVIYVGNQKIEPVNGVYTFNTPQSTTTYTYGGYRFVVGYPKNNYDLSQDKILIESHSTLTGIYYSEDERKELSDVSTTIDLKQYDVTYSGNLYNITKTNNYKSSKAIYEGITGVDSTLNHGSFFFMNMNARYSGETMDVVYGDDLLFITDKNGNYRKLDDYEYFFESLEHIYTYYNANGMSFNATKYDAEIWVRYQNHTEYEFYSKVTSDRISFNGGRVVGWYIIFKNAEESIKSHTYIYVRVNYDNVDEERTAEQGRIYNFNNLKVYINGELQNSVELNNINNYEVPKETIAEADTALNGTYLQRAADYEDYVKYTVPDGKYSVGIRKIMGNTTQNIEKEKFTGRVELRLLLGSEFGTQHSDVSEHTFNTYYINGNKIAPTLKGWNIYDLLPKGMELESTAEEIKESFVSNKYNSTQVLGNWFGKKSYSYIDNKYIYQEEFIQLLKDSTHVEIIKNYKGTGRTFIHISIDFSTYPLVIFDLGNYGGLDETINFYYNYSVPYDEFVEYGNEWENHAYTDYVGNTVDRHYYFAGTSKDAAVYNTYDGGVIDNGSKDLDELDINSNGSTNDRLSYYKSNITIPYIISSTQDVQTTAKSEDYSYNSSKTTVELDSNYEYKLRVRTGDNDVTNLIIYDSIEKYAKDSSQSFINAYGARKYWQGEFLGVDTSHPESKGYNVKVYYSESEQPGSLKEDNSWQEYSDSIDKTKVKSLAFEYLDEHGNPAIIPANSLTYVLINMKSPNEELKTFAYNGCWTEWNAIDPITDQPIDFVTGINSNIVRVALPSSVEPEDIELTLTKKWIDNANSATKRPENVTFRIIPNDDYSKSTEVTFGGTGNNWSYNVTVPKYDDDGEEIEYTIKEDTINLEENYKYVPSVDNYEVTNTLYKNIVITKNWLDNNNAYLTRPSNITVKVYQNGNYYKDLNITGDYSTNTWTGSLSVPVFDNSGNEYTYTVDEISVDNYDSTCENLVCTNLLTGNDKITITKEWIDDNNSYNTRPSSISVILKQNGNEYQNVTLTGNDNTWESDEITVPMYDNNGVKYTYTIIENTIPSYGLVSYDQENFKVTNTLKETTLLTITKIWKDNNNEYQTRPDSLSITLLQNDTEYQTLSLSGNTDTWTTTIEVPKYDDNQQEYTYSIKEVNDNLTDYQDITYSDNDLTVTNGLKKDYELTIKKVWQDHNNDYLTRPESINVKILQNNEEYQTIEMSGNSNEWTKTITVPYYDSNNKKYEYTIVEDLEISKYGSITYDQTTHTITNELTEVPQVTLYFTVLNGYVEPGTNEIKYDEEGFRETLRKHGIDPDSDYEFTFELQNIETNKIYEGKLSTKGILQFEDIPYGDYRALEGKDDIFEFVSMESIGDVLGVKFTPGKNGGIISIRPTGQNIIYGANITNKITAPVKNPNTGTTRVVIISLLLMVLSLVIILFVIKKYPKLIKGHVN